MKSNLALTYKDKPVEEFEEIIKNYYGFPYGISVPSASLGYSLLALSLNKNIFNTTIFTWYSTITPFLFGNFKLKFNTLNPLYPNLALNISNNSILNLCNIRGVPFTSEYLKKLNGLKIIDNSQGFGALDEKGNPAGKDADVLILSFNDEKDLALGGGGIILMKDSKLFEQTLLIARHPDEQIKRLKIQPNYFYINYKINSLAARKGIKIFNKKLEKVKKRQEKIMPLLEKLVNEGFIKPYPKNIIPSFWKEILCLWNEKPNWKALISFLKDKNTWTCSQFQLPELEYIWKRLENKNKMWIKNNLPSFLILKKRCF